MQEEGREYITPEIEKRQHRRARLVTQVICETLGRESIMVTRDVSVGGMFVSTKNPFPQDCEVALSFRLRAADAPLSCRGKIVYAIAGMGMGIEFAGLSEQGRQALQKFVDEAD
jgi:hypothetical protein